MKDFDFFVYHENLVFVSVLFSQSYIFNFFSLLIYIYMFIYVCVPKKIECTLAIDSPFQTFGTTSCRIYRLALPLLSLVWCSRPFTHQWKVEGRLCQTMLSPEMCIE